MVSRKGPAIELADEEVEKALKDIVAWAEDEFEDKEANEADNIQTYQVAISYSAPSRPREGMIAYADGTKWNPGAGAGMYYYSSAGTWLQMTERPVRGSISGLLLSTLGSTTFFGVSPGRAVDDTGVVSMDLVSAIFKTTTSWVVGTSQGGLDTGTIAASTWYHVFLIKNLASGNVDVLYSLSPTAPTMPAGYTVKRLIGSVLTTAGSLITDFIQIGDETLWRATVTGVGTAGSVAATALTLAGIPTGIKVNAKLSALAVANAGGEGRFRLYSPDQNDEAVATTNLNAGTFGVASEQQASDLYVRTNTSAQIRMISVSATSSLTIGVHGFIHPRGKDD